MLKLHRNEAVLLFEYRTDFYIHTNEFSKIVKCQDK